MIAQRPLGVACPSCWASDCECTGDDVGAVIETLEAADMTAAEAVASIVARVRSSVAADKVLRSCGYEGAACGYVLIPLQEAEQLAAALERR